MSENFDIDLHEKTIKKLIRKKEEMGFAKKSWDEWFNNLIGDDNQESLKNTIEKIFNENGLERFYDDWIRNFSINLENIWNGQSARELFPEDQTEHSAIVIGRGPSLKEHNHLELLAKSDYKGLIVCCDGALPAVLKAGVTPEKFPKFFVVTIDTQEHQKKFYEESIVQQHGKGIRCILSTTVSPLTFQAVKKTGMKVFWIHALFDYNKGNSSFNYISGIMSKAKNHKKGLPAIQTGGNVGTSSWMISWSILKCPTVCLIGLDHSYAANTPIRELSYDSKLGEIDENSEAFKKAFPIIHNPEFNCDCRQDPIFQYYGNALKEFIERVSKNVKTINATEGGALFGKGINCMTFSNFIDKYKK